jgi:hypothetical protein
MVDLDQQTDVSIFQTRKEPELPEGARTIKDLTQYKLDGSEERGLITRRSKLSSENVPIDREVRVVDPKWRPTEQRRRLDDFTQRRDTDETAVEAAFDHLEIEDASRVKQRLATQDTQTSEVCRHIRPLDAERTLVDQGKA